MRIIYKNEIKSLLKYCLDKQLLKKDIWKQFVEVFLLKSDAADNGWRGEYFGKTLRGACSIYEVYPSKELYDTLEKAVLDFLKVQDESGRFTSYKEEWKGWDMWARKYVLSSLQAFYKICQNENLKQNILSALKKHADYIIDCIGPDKTDILDTSDVWGGLNSASIAETYLSLYKLTRDEKYLKFGKYIISSGGSKNGNLVEIAKENKLYPYQYPVTKAYEMMSFFESLLDYYEITGEKEYFDIFSNFINKVRESEITVIGGAGCTDELFDNSVFRQTEPTDTFMQETCVTVTWMRLLDKYYKISKEEWCLDELEKSFVNDILGMVNEKGNRSYSFFDKEYVEVLPFDSYSPLYKSRRGIATGGIKDLPNGTHYGCCCAIASSGIGVFIKNIIQKENEQYIIRYLLPCELNDGESLIKVKNSYLTDNKIFIEVSGKTVSMRIRLPKGSTVSVNGKEYVKGGKYFEVNGFIGSIQIMLHYQVEQIEINDKICYKYGPMVLAQDENIAPISTIVKEVQKVEYVEDSNTFRHLRINDIDFIDYAHVGKRWDEKLITVWSDTK